VIDLSLEDWANVQRDADCLERLVARRKSEIVVTGPLVHSKTAWKCAVLQQSLLYRITMLATGCADMWNVKNMLGSILLARALLETIAISEFIADELKQLVSDKKINDIDELINKQLFSTKNEVQIAEGWRFQARSILTYIDKFDKHVAGIRETYDFLSEICHPNGSGHLSTYGMNRRTGTVTFSEADPFVLRSLQGHVLTCFGLIVFAEGIMDTFDQIVLNVPDLEPDAGSNPANWAINLPSSFPSGKFGTRIRLSHRHRRNHHSLWKRNAGERRMGASSRFGAQLRGQSQRCVSNATVSLYRK
jgi:hypothetical protein